MTHRIRTIATAIVRPPSPSLLDAVFSGVDVDNAAPAADDGGVERSSSQAGRLRPERHDLASALRADLAAPEDELTTWPAAGRLHDGRHGC